MYQQLDGAAEAWRTVSFEAIDSTCAETVEYLTILRETYFDAQLRSFRIGPNDFIEDHISRNILHLIGFFSQVAEADAFKSESWYSCHEHLSESYQGGLNSKEVFEWSSPFMLGGELAQTLHEGGAYHRVRDAALAIRVSNAMAEVLIEGDYEGTLVYSSLMPWSEFFKDIAWDRSWIIVRKPTRTIHVVLATDTD